MYKILIVEDEAIAAEYLRMVLEKRGWEVVDSVDNGVDALAALRQHEPHLVLMDIMIQGGKSGCEVAMEMHKISHCSIVFTTAYADEEMISYAMEARADGYIIKPYNEKELIATISLLCAKHTPLNPLKTTRIAGGFYFDHDSGLLYKDAEVVKIGPRALKFIQVLCANRHTCVSYETLYASIWDDAMNLKKLQMVVYRIREACGEGFLENINGMGYRICLDYPLPQPPAGV